MTKTEIAQLREKRVEEYFQMKCQWETFSKSQEDRFALFRERKNLIGTKWFCSLFYFN